VCSCSSLAYSSSVAGWPSSALRARLGQWWDCRVYDASYGSTETGTLAASCPAGQLHLLTTANYFELDSGSGLSGLPVSGTGRLVVTPLNLYARPLLRFDTGDDAVVGGGCRCGSLRPTVEILGRASETVWVKGSPLTVRAVEDVVYGATTATGYLVEIDERGGYGRLVLERDTDTDRACEPPQHAAVQRWSQDRLGLRWDDVVFVNALPATTKSGGSQKNWKRSNIRLVGAP
jgi:phenylacetate-coenzyme A ligase PaaK-like adenylate-forming protein